MPTLAELIAVLRAATEPMSGSQIAEALERDHPPSRVLGWSRPWHADGAAIHYELERLAQAGLVRSDQRTTRVPAPFGRTRQARRRCYWLVGASADLVEARAQAERLRAILAPLLDDPWDTADDPHCVFCDVPSVAPHQPECPVNRRDALLGRTAQGGPT